MSIPSHFDEATSAFREFLSKQRRPQAIEWVFREDVLQVARWKYIRVPLPRENAERAKTLYMAGVERGLGVAIDAFSHSANVTYAWIFVPWDNTDAEYSMVGSEHLKLSVPETVTSARIVRSAVAWSLLRFRASLARRATFADLLPSRSEA
jgi:hypothetical protein